MKLSAILLCSVAIIAAAPVQAADHTAQEATDVPSESSDGDIIVTANKRNQRLQDVGLSIAAVSGDDLKSRQIASLADISQAVPGLSYSNSQNNTPVFTLRGVGFYDTSLAAYPTSSVYIDQAPLPFSVMTTLTAFDLERIEVLKGPQGTLFGNNATGGAINYIAAKPTGEFSAGADLSYARFNTFTGEAFISGALSPDLRGRVAVRVSDGDGWQKSYTRNDRSGATRSYAGRVLLDWDASDNVRFQLNVNGWIDKSEPQAPQFIQYFGQFPVATPIATQPLAPRSNRFADWSPDTPPKANNRLFQTVLRGDIDLSEVVQLTSISTYVHYKHFQNLEGDGTPFHGIDLIPNKGDIKSLAQEIRLSNGASSGLRWIVGGNYSQDKVYESNRIRFEDATPAVALGIFGLLFETRQKMKNYAAFGNVEYDIDPAFTIKAGVRYTKADRHTKFCNNDPFTGTTNIFFTNLSRALTGQNVPTILPEQCFPLRADNLPSRVPTEVSLNEDNISWRAGVDWKAASGLLVYANISKGYKAGSNPTLSASSVTQYRSVTQESVLAYEAGIKAQPFGKALTINGAIYYYKYDDKQLKSRVIDAVFGPLDILQNIPKSSVRGAEVEIVARPVAGLTLAANLVYVDAKIDKFIGVNGAGIVADFADAPVPFSPKWRSTLSGDYVWGLGSNLEASLGGTYYYQSHSVTVIGGVDPYTINKYGLLDLRAGIGRPDGSWRVSVWGKNVTGKVYSSNTFSGNDELLRYAGRPRTYGVTIGWKY